MEGKFRVSPYTVIIDTREQSPFSFLDLKADSSAGGGLIVLKTERKALATGDYSVGGLEDSVAVERKSLEDLFFCVGNDRGRFEKQLERLDALDCGRVVVEADWARILRGCQNSRLKPKSVVRSVIAWQMDYFPRVHWWLCPGKRMAELVTFRILDRYWRKHADRSGE